MTEWLDRERWCRLKATTIPTKNVGSPNYINGPQISIHLPTRHVLKFKADDDRNYSIKLLLADFPTNNFSV